MEYGDSEFEPHPIAPGSSEHSYKPLQLVGGLQDWSLPSASISRSNDRQPLHRAPRTTAAVAEGPVTANRPRVVNRTRFAGASEHPYNAVIAGPRIPVRIEGEGGRWT